MAAAAGVGAARATTVATAVAIHEASLVKAHTVWVLLAA